MTRHPEGKRYQENELNISKQLVMKNNPNPQHPLNLRRYLLATIIPILLLTVSLSLFLYDQLQQHTFIKKEIEGVQTIKMLYGGLTDLQKIRGYSQIFLWGHSEVDENLKKLKEHFLDTFHQKDWLRQVDIFRVQAESVHLYDKAQDLFLIDLTDAGSVDLFNEYSQLISEILQLMQLTADRSNLILDPELDTYYLIDILTKQIPYLSESIGKVRGLGSGLIAKGRVSKEETDQLQGFLTIIRTRINNVKEAQTVLSKVAADIAQKVDMLPDDLEKILCELFAQCRYIVEDHIQPAMNPEDFFQLATTAIDLIDTPYQGGLSLLFSRLETRRNKQLQQGTVIFLGTAVTILLLLYFNRSFYLNNKKLHEEMAELSITDQLTGLYNRRHFYAVFPRELRTSLRHGCRLYIALLDVDFFKRYNDTYGHPKGDVVLHRIGATMLHILRRADDYCFRIGGEEFCFFFIEQDLKKAEMLTEKMRAAIEGLHIPHEGNTPYGVVTVSLGLIEVPAEADCPLERIMPELDHALYAAKKAGRNRYTVAG